MAQMIPDSIRKTATSGEKLLYKSLKEYLPEEYLVYYEPDIKGRRPDFLVMGPKIGILILEVKDYTRNTLVNLNPDEWLIQYGNADITTVKNPLKQAREYAFHVANFLKKEKSLIQWEGDQVGKLKFPYGFGTVFTKLTQEQCIADQIYHVIDPQLLLTRSEIDPQSEAFSATALLDKLYGMVPYRKPDKEYLTQEDMNTIRFHLFPEVRISADWGKPSKYKEEWLLSLTDVKTMDLHQESLAKQIGEQHRLIRGVAGSGKTVILASRVKTLLKNHPDWKILVLCYNIALANVIKQMIQQKLMTPEDLLDMISETHGNPEFNQIEVYNYHEFVTKKLGLKENEAPKEDQLPVYDAILIDEGQDFEPEWLQLISQCLNPNTQSLLIVEDRAQNIYKRKWNLLQHTGLDFRGRSRYLSINYRNTAEILNFAWNFYQAHSSVGSKTGKTEDLIEIIPPRHTHRKGPEPIVCRSQNFQEEIHFVAKSIQKLNNQFNIPYSDMLILYRIKKNKYIPYVDILKNVLDEHRLPYFWISENNDTKRKFLKQENSIKISTIESAKGLDFRAVFVVNLDNIPFKLVEDEEREAALLYIAMTRAVEWLFLSYSGRSKYTDYLESITQVHERRPKHVDSQVVKAEAEVAATSEIDTIEKQDEPKPIEERESNMAKATFDVVSFSKENHNKLVFETLRGWRKKKAALDIAPAYTIIEDKSLLILATFIPHTQEEFLSLPYFKEKRWEQYGIELLEILKKYDQTYDIFKYFPRYVSVTPTAKSTKIEQPQSIIQKIMGIFK